ncbi:MAG: ATP-binding protein [Leptospira sp.]|uniref:ATP-binding protein n=1 Tax=Leptospira paudalimensis TaxID=2950024 RepID=A0ABT3M973_9LEPT|nr:MULTISPECIES: ATP-binding protein [Leptospira]MBL0955589.1 ATP-binding protein [Leptospira sp.]MCW7504925.1 ATP-binding protein [Leptospira paudalimensis]
MPFPLSRTELEKEIKTLFSNGLSGNVNDFTSWVFMETQRKFKDVPNVTLETVTTVMDEFVKDGLITTNPIDPREYYITDESPIIRKMGTSESFVILGALHYNPMQYVRARLAYFLKRNGIDEELRMDLCIATVEAVENAAKYGDGGGVEVTFQIDKQKVFSIEMINTVKDFNLEDDIQRGKFSSTATLMRGMMVMQKLFDSVDLEITDNRKQAILKATRKLT